MSLIVYCWAIKGIGVAPYINTNTGFAHSKRATLNIEVATWNTEVMAAQGGTELATGATEVVEYDIISYNTTDGYKTKFAAIGDAGEELSFVYILNNDGTQGEAFTQGTAPATGVFTYSTSSQAITFSSDDAAALASAGNPKLVCAYERMTSGDSATKMVLTGTAVPKVVLVTGFGVVQDICSNVAWLCQFNGKAQIDGNYTFDLSADGDPSVQSLNLEFVRDCGVEELYSFVIYDDDDIDDNM